MTVPFQIILLTPGFAADENDTSCLPALQDFVLGWKRCCPGISLSVISFQYPHRPKSYTWHSIPVYAAGGHDKNGLMRLYTWLKVFFHLVLMKKKKRTVLLSYFLTEATFIAQQFTKIFATDHIAIAAGQDVRTTNAYLQKLHPDKLTVVVFNQQMNAELLQATGRKADAVIPMGLLQQVTADGTADNRIIDVLIVSSLIPLKQVDKAIRIISLLKHEFPDIRAQIIGKGSGYDTLIELVTTLGLNEQVTFTGAVSREAVREKMRAAKILLHTSASEGQSTVISEALSAGMYVVCHDVGRIMDHPKIAICTDEAAMLLAMKSILHLPQPDFSPVEILPVEETIKAYTQLIESLH